MGQGAHLGCIVASLVAWSLLEGILNTASSREPAGQHEEAGQRLPAAVLWDMDGVLTIAGVPMPSADLVGAPPAQTVGNSCMIVVATDAPLDARQLGRVARRAVFAMARVGADYAQGSGDYALAFSVGTGHPPADEALDPILGSTMDAVEEALLNSVLAATTTQGRHGRTVLGVPGGAVRERLRRAGVVVA
ncbi:P1 family peptidase [Mumia sp. zg.B53]|nr:P1 family peptidase [Mumia sp. zg.B53]MBW9215169.1 P1 family peptidase [Mumia sp. zg.B53]